MEEGHLFKILKCKKKKHYANKTFDMKIHNQNEVTSTKIISIE